MAKKQPNGEGDIEEAKRAHQEAVVYALEEAEQMWVETVKDPSASASDRIAAGQCLAFMVMTNELRKTHLALNANVCAIAQTAERIFEIQSKGQQVAILDKSILRQ